MLHLPYKREDLFHIIWIFKQSVMENQFWKDPLVTVNVMERKIH